MRFKDVAEYFDSIEGIASRNKMISILAELIKKSNVAEASVLSYLIQGEIDAPFRAIRFNIADKLCVKAIADAYNISQASVEKKNRKLGDLGLVAESFSKGVGRYNLKEVYLKLKEISEVTGKGSVDKKIKLLSKLLKDCSGVEGKYITRIVLGRMRLGASDYTFLDALSVVKRGDKSLREGLERAYSLCSDLGKVSEVFLKKGEKGLDKFQIEVFSPIRMALAQRLSTAKDIVKKIGRCAIEPKYDGFRIQIHKKDSKVKIFSRNLEDMTDMFPELVRGSKEIKAREIIFEGEAIAYDESSDQFLPFQITVKRKRKYEIEKMAKDYPLVCFVFDALFLNGKDLTKKPYEMRRKALSKLVKAGGVFRLTDVNFTNNSEEIEKIFDHYVSAGLEGVLAKDLKAEYTAGARKYAWIKLKRSYKGKLSDTVDLCIVGYLKGRGKRAKLGIGSLLGATYNKKEDVFETLAKIGSGLTEKGTLELKKTLDKYKVAKKPARLNSKLKMDVWVKPAMVVEILADEITKSPAHTCAESKGEGLSLRFPRVVKLRPDKKPEDATSTKEVVDMFKKQRRK